MVTTDRVISPSTQTAAVEFEPEVTGAVARERTGAVGVTYTKNMWYYALPGKKLARGKTVSKTMLGEPLLIGRDANGVVFAMKDICPHQGVPLSEGRFDGNEVECPFHGWRFDTSGSCTAIPSLCPDQEFPVCRVKTLSHPCREVLGSIWVFFGQMDGELPEVPHAPGLEGLSYDQTTCRLLIPTHIDYAVAALIDPAHVPFVHNAWWWRSAKTLKEKQKVYVGSGTGWTMVRHRPSPHSVFKYIGKYIETEIGFRLPGCRIEHIIFNGRTVLSGISALTPIDENHTELNHTTYWTIPGLAPWVTPFVDYFVKEFLSQDQRIAQMQEKILTKYKPNLIMTIKDAGLPGKWYFQCKKEWNDATTQGRAFINPIKETVLRWLS